MAHEKRGGRFARPGFQNQCWDSGTSGCVFFPSLCNGGCFSHIKCAFVTFTLHKAAMLYYMKFYLDTTFLAQRPQSGEQYIAAYNESAMHQNDSKQQNGQISANHIWELPSCSHCSCSSLVFHRSPGHPLPIFQSPCFPVVSIYPQVFGLGKGTEMGVVGKDAEDLQESFTLIPCIPLSTPSLINDSAALNHF